MSLRSPPGSYIHSCAAKAHCGAGFCARPRLRQVATVSDDAGGIDRPRPQPCGSVTGLHVR
eukprot:2825132-Prorocentrum_lima.AAC.1